MDSDELAKNGRKTRIVACTARAGTTARSLQCLDLIIRDSGWMGIVKRNRNEGADLSTNRAQGTTNTRRGESKLQPLHKGQILQVPDLF